jgi:acyl carrier protein
MTKSELFAQCVQVLHETFDIPREKVTPEARLYDDLDIDSIDAIDLLVRLKPVVGRRVQPEAFKQVRTVQDVVDALYVAMQAPDSASSAS